MRRNRLFAKPGLPWIGLSVLLTIICAMTLHYIAIIIMLVLTMGLMGYYYDFERDLPSHPLSVMSPVDGVVTTIELFYDPFLQRPSQRIQIQSSLFRTYHVRSPTEGQLKQYWPTTDGIAQGSPLFKGYRAWWVRTDEGDDVVMTVSNDGLWQQASCVTQIGERIGQGRRYGHFPLLCKIEMLIDQSAFINVSVGQRVKAGVDSLATFNHDVSVLPTHLPG